MLGRRPLQGIAAALCVAGGLMLVLTDSVAAAAAALACFAAAGVALIVGSRAT